SCCCRTSERGLLLRPGLLYGVEFPIALFDAARPLVPGKRGADMVGASALACSGDFLLRLAGCQRKDLVAEVRRTAFAATGFRLRPRSSAMKERSEPSNPAPTPTSRCSNCATEPSLCETATTIP